MRKNDKMKKKELSKLSEEQKEAVTTCYGEVVYKYVKLCGICGGWYGTDFTDAKGCHKCRPCNKLGFVTTK